MGQLTAAEISRVEGTVGHRAEALQRLGILCGVTAGAWLGAAEAPTKLVSSGLSPFFISFVMVIGVFLGRWSVPAIARGTSGIRSDVRSAPHLVVWAVIAGALWAIANTLTIFAIRDLGLSIAFPLWNTNALIGMGWGVLFFQELRKAGWTRWTAVCVGMGLMFLGGMTLARVSATQISATAASKGVVAALGAGLLWGTMYIPYRKAYLSGMNPLSFVSFFTVGELVMMSFLATHYLGGPTYLWQEVSRSRHMLFWLFAAGFVWVVGDIFQQYAVKYVGVSRGIPLSNSNQLWGLVWGAVAFGEFQHWKHSSIIGAVYGSLLMAGGLVAISFSVAGEEERLKWRHAAEREQNRYELDGNFVSAAFHGKSGGPTQSRRWFDWLLIATVTGVFIWSGSIAQWPSMALNCPAVYVLIAIGFALFAVSAVRLWKITRFN